MRDRTVLRRVLRALALIACGALVLSGVFSTTATAAPSQSSASSNGVSGHFALYPRGEFTPMAESGIITAGDCEYKQANDYPHVTDNQASVHGWWIDWNNKCPDKAHVKVSLQAYWCDSSGCRFITVASGSGDYYEGGGSGKRATAKQPCATNSEISWRGYTDVDIPWVVDPSGVTYSEIRDLYCTPS